MSTHEDYSRQQDVKGPSDRSFGWVFVVFFALVGAWPAVHGRPVRVWPIAAAVALAGVTALRPSVLHPANVLWMKFGLLLSKVVNPLVTGLLFYAVITPVGLLMRFFGKHSLGVRFEPDAKSYWIERRPPGPEPDSMSQQF